MTIGRQDQESETELKPEEDCLTLTVQYIAKHRREQEEILECLQKERDEREERLQKERQECEEKQLEQQEKCNDMQMETEEKWIKHEKKLLQMLQECDDKRRKAEQKLKLAYKPENQDQPQDCLIRFEDTMNQAESPEDQCPHRLRPLLSDRALMACSRDVSDEAKRSSQQLKEALLDSLGLPVKQYRESFQRKGSDSPQDTARKLEIVMQRAVHGCKSVQDVLTQLTMAKFLALYPLDVANYVQLQDPRSVGEAANLVQEYQQRQQDRDHSRHYSYKPPWMRSYDRSAGGFCEDPNAGGFHEERQNSDTSEGASHEAEKPGESSRASDSYRGSGRTGRDSFRQGPADWRDRVPTCFSCGKKGHKRPECPNQVARVVSPVGHPSLRVEGCIGDHECQMTIDRCPAKTVVKAHLVKPGEYTLGIPSTYWDLMAGQ